MKKPRSNTFFPVILAALWVVIFQITLEILSPNKPTQLLLAVLFTVSIALLYLRTLIKSEKTK